MNPALTPAKLLWTADDICQTLSIGRSKFFEMVSNETFAPLPIRRFGRKVLYSAESVRKWVQDGCPTRSQWKPQKGVNS